MTSKELNELAVTQTFLDMGFELIETNNKGLAYIKLYPSEYILITDQFSLDIPRKWLQPIIIGYYSNYDDSTTREAVWTTLSFLSLNQLTVLC